MPVEKSSLGGIQNGRSADMVLDRDIRDRIQICNLPAWDEL
jgi:hypothetical protein